MRLLIAAVLGGILEYERERKGRSAGVRTNMLVAVGAALFVVGPLQSGMETGDLSRVLQGIVQGIGFLGAGAIMVRSAQRQVEGLSTAANIWATAAIGVIAGLGLEATAVLSTAIVLLILAAVSLILPKLPRRAQNQTGLTNVKIVANASSETARPLRAQLMDHPRYQPMLMIFSVGS